MNSNLLILKLNQLEHWLEETKGHYGKYPLRWLGYMVVAIVMVMSNLLALIRWPIHSLIKVFQTTQSNVEVAIHSSQPNDVDADLLDEILKKRPKVLVDFWAAWCGPCIMMNEPLKKIAVSKDTDCTIVKVNTVKYSQLTEQYNVKGLPTLVLFEKGKEVKRYAGALSYTELKDFINS
ncbi:thioredoxin family protein [Aliifodinibius salicampi]|uniref:Thioredoxin family protein n=1 Tax=Fodinibius salicampi TaxID=1920655 RepID=A0ABT3PWD7_9BACT|nr:thioredoxin family protein [Fodinibius salicampi]MCW9712157.1 thioredoxin family protein [Fodinibius salicampi]